MIRAHRIRLNPTPEQATYFAMAAGTRRFTYNWALAEWTRQYKAGEKPSALKLKKQFNALKRDQFPWVYEVTKCAVEGAFVDLARAFENFFAGRAQYPKFKAKKRSREGFYLANDKFTVNGHWIKVPKLGWVNMTESLRFEGKIMSAQVSRTADWWFVSITVEQPDQPTPEHPGEAVGIDLGLNHLATLSDGRVLENQKPLRRRLRKLKRLQRSLSRKQKGSANREKARRKVARQHYKVSCARDDVLHKFTTDLVRNYSVVVIEDLNVRGMLKNHRLALSISDAGFGKFKTLLENKANQTGTVVVKVDRFFPSSKTCHQCGQVKRDLSLADRVYRCECGLECDRDHNAAINILNEGLRLIGAV